MTVQEDDPFIAINTTRLDPTDQGVRRLGPLIEQLHDRHPKGVQRQSNLPLVILDKVLALKLNPPQVRAKPGDGRPNSHGDPERAKSSR
jgi:hypothetical protein